MYAELQKQVRRGNNEAGFQILSSHWPKLYAVNLKTGISENSKKKLEKLYYEDDKKYEKLLNMKFSWLKGTK